MYATGFDNIYINGNTKFYNNVALTYGADIDASNSNNNISLYLVNVTNTVSISSIKLE